MKISRSRLLNQASGLRQLASALMLVIVSSFALQSSEVNAVEGAEERVSVIKRAVPTYPKYAVKRGIEGAVLVSFSIEKDGNVSDIQVEASDQDGLFDASAILAVQRWVYSKPSQKVRNNYIALEFALSDQPETTKFSHVEVIQVRGE